MIDSIIVALHQAMPYVYILCALAFIIKFILVVNSKGFDLPALFISFFKIYSKSQRNTSSQRRKVFMKYNNFINYFLYVAFTLFIILLIIYQGGMFNYSN